MVILKNVFVQMVMLKKKLELVVKNPHLMVVIAQIKIVLMQLKPVLLTDVFVLPIIPKIKIKMVVQLMEN
jgi:hypothetical protein